MDGLTGLGSQQTGVGNSEMKRTALLALLLATAAAPVMAKPHHADRHSHYAYQHSHYANRHADHRAGQHSSIPADHSHITCDMVRSYVAQVGLQQAKAMAAAAGMTASEERRARQCLASGV